MSEHRAERGVAPDAGGDPGGTYGPVAGDPGVSRLPGSGRRPGPSLGSDAPLDTPDLAKLTDRLRGPLGVVAVAATGLLVVALLAVLKVAKAIALPIMVAVLLNFVLSPAVRFLEKRLRLPTAAAAGLILFSVLGAAGFGLYQLTGPALTWVEKAPDTIRRAEWKLRGLKRQVDEVSQAAKEVESLARVGGEEGEEQRVQVENGEERTSFFTQTRQLLAGGAVAFFLLFFLLGAGDRFLRTLAHVLPRFEHRRRAVTIARRTEEEVSRYLSTFAMINLGLGAAVAAAMWLLGMPNPILWGALAGLLNFIPYIGPLVGIMATGIVAITTFDATGRALLVPLAYFVLNAMEGNLVTPLVMGRRMTLNPVAIFLSVIFWGWLWGIPGALLAVPLLAVFKIMADNIPPLQPVGAFLG